MMNWCIFIKVNFPSGLKNTHNVQVLRELHREKVAPSPAMFFPELVDREFLICNNNHFVLPFPCPCICPWKICPGNMKLQRISWRKVKSGPWKSSCGTPPHGQLNVSHFIPSNAFNSEVYHEIIIAFWTKQLLYNFHHKTQLILVATNFLVTFLGRLLDLTLGRTINDDNCGTSINYSKSDYLDLNTAFTIRFVFTSGISYKSVYLGFLIPNWD